MNIEDINKHAHIRVRGFMAANWYLPATPNEERVWLPVVIAQDNDGAEYLFVNGREEYIYICPFYTYIGRMLSNFSFMVSGPLINIYKGDIKTLEEIEFINNMIALYHKLKEV